MFCFQHCYSSCLLWLSPSSMHLVVSLLQHSFEVLHVVPMWCLQLHSLVPCLLVAAPMVSTTHGVGVSSCLAVSILFLSAPQWIHVHVVCSSHDLVLQFGMHIGLVPCFGELYPLVV